MCNEDSLELNPVLASELHYIKIHFFGVVQDTIIKPLLPDAMIYLCGDVFKFNHEHTHTNGTRNILFKIFTNS